MEKKPVLVIMAAGMGSRYGGLKQIDPVDREGDLIIDFSIYDAVEAGFEKVVFIIKKAIEKDFKEHIGRRMEKHVEVEYVYQETDVLPDGYEVPEGRVKPWGTGHAVLCCKDVIDGPFAVINADDYYGKTAFREIYNQLASHGDDEKYQYTMVGYELYNSITENGHVARGICSTDENHRLVDIQERTRIENHGGRAEYTEDDGKTWVYLPHGTIVSMNMWGLTPEFFQILESGFETFVANTPADNLKAEYLLPTIIGDLLAEKKLAVKVLTSKDKWFGVTYKEDKDSVVSELQALIHAGVYPKKLF